MVLLHVFIYRNRLAFCNVSSCRNCPYPPPHTRSKFINTPTPLKPHPMYLNDFLLLFLFSMPIPILYMKLVSGFVVSIIYRLINANFELNSGKFIYLVIEYGIGALLFPYIFHHSFKYGVISLSRNLKCQSYNAFPGSHFWLFRPSHHQEERTFFRAHICQRGNSYCIPDFPGQYRHWIKISW